MAAPPVSRPPDQPIWVQFALFFAVLLGILAMLFHSSFSPGETLFANDAPLGALVGYIDATWSYFTGAWHDLNWIGSHEASALPNVTFSAMLLLRPLAYSKFFVPITLAILGLSAWVLFRRLRFAPWICALGGLAAALNTDSFSYACWGLPAVALAPAMVFLALVGIHSALEGRSILKAALAGMAVGMGVMEAFDVGAIFSLYVAAFTFFLVWIQPGPAPQKIRTGIGRVTIVAVFAVLLAAQGLSTLIETQIKGVVGMEQNQESREERWDQATQWSLPKIETLRLIIPGLFGYRMDTPGGGQYWGAVGQDPAVPALLDRLSTPDEKERSQAVQELRRRLLRHSGSGTYAGVLLVLLAWFALAQSLRTKESPYSAVERKCVWFWSAAALLSLLLAFGRHAPFYRLAYALPYFSTIRNPVKFLHPLHLSLVILFGYGLVALERRYLGSVARPGSIIGHVKDWWARAADFEKRWTLGMGVVVGASLLGWLLYASSRNELLHHLGHVGFGGPSATAIASFSLKEAGLFVLFLALSASCVTLVISGAFAGGRAKWAGALLGVLLVMDLARANAPWISYYNYRERYAGNPVTDFLRDRAYEKRVTALRFDVPPEAAKLAEFFQQLYGGEWVQHLFQYYRVQSLDIVQMPREKRDYEAFMVKTFSPLAYQARLWQLTSTRYLLGLAGFADALNQNFDPVQRRFRVHTLFNFEPSPDGQIKLVVNTNGPFGLIEDGAALPRASLFSQWQVSTNDPETLKLLTNPAFDPEKTVLVADPLPAPGATDAVPQKPGTVTFTHYEPKCIRLSAQAERPAVLLFNDRFDPNWKVRVDGRLEQLLRCNYLMRGVLLRPGQHTVEFRFQPPVSTLYVSLATLLLGVIFAGVLVFVPHSADAECGMRNAKSES